MIDESKKEILENASHKKLFFTYAIPSIVALLFFGVQTIIDGVVVGNYIGADALGGVNIVLPFYSFIFVIAIMIAVGSQAQVGMHMGRQDKELAQNAMTTGFWALLVFSLILTALLFLFADKIAFLFGADESLAPYSYDYLRGLMIFIFPTCIVFYSDFMLKVMGHPKASMWILSTSVVLNIILNLLFVIVFEMGTYGVSMATGIAFTIGLFISATITFNPKKELSILKGKFKWALFKKAFYNGSSEGVAELSSATAILLINLTIMKYVGAEGVSAFTAINYIYFVGILVFLGISDGLIPVISYNYGAKNYKRVWGILKFLSVINFSLGVLLFIAILFGGEFIASLFFKESEANILEIAGSGLIFYSFAFLINGLNILAASFFTALGDAKRSVIIALSRGIVFLAIGVFVFPKFMGVNGIWLSIPFAEIMTLIITIYLVLKMRVVLNKS